jgi:hypothetical protein
MHDMRASGFSLFHPATQIIKAYSIVGRCILCKTQSVFWGTSYAAYAGLQYATVTIG